MSGVKDISPSPSPAPYDDSADPPLISALFLIKFDLKVGYTITWKRSVAGLELDGAVEFKSLPSGLHSVKEDLIYFIHEQYAGLSAFANTPASESERNAHLVAVGVLVPLSYGRLGRSWLHAQKLQDLAKSIVNDTSHTDALEEFWKEHRADQDAKARRPSASVGGGSKKHSRSRALSSLTNVLPSEQALAPYHPGRSILEFLNTFGPLIFPLHRAALMRKRILLLGSPPVKLNCEFVFDLSILANIPASISNLLPADAEPNYRLRSFFSIGIPDIALLETGAKAAREAEQQFPDSFSDTPVGWVACTTDDVLAMKNSLYDILIEMPAKTEHAPQERQWPKMKSSSGTEIKATQRDLRRWKLLHQELYKAQNITEYPPYDDNNLSDDDDDGDNESNNDQTGLLQTRRSSPSKSSSNEDEAEYDEKLIEPTTWSELAFNGFMWWASAGERDAAEEDEAEHDRQVIGQLSDFIPRSPRASRVFNSNGDSNTADPSSSVVSLASSDNGIHTAIIAYFHRLTAGFVSNLADVVDNADDDVDEELDGVDEAELKPLVHVESEDIGRMGLDVWSENDRVFAREMLRLYFGREAVVKGASVECCGLRIY